MKISNIITHNPLLSDREVITIVDSEDRKMQIIESKSNDIQQVTLNASECRNVLELLNKMFKINS